MTGQNSLALYDRDNLCQTLIRFNRLGPTADVTVSNLYVRFTPKAGIERVLAHVRWVPIADSCAAAK
jgi:hypothetical protein